MWQAAGWANRFPVFSFKWTSPFPACEINSMYLRNVYRTEGHLNIFPFFRSRNISISWDVLYQDERLISAGTHMFLSKPLFQFFACHEFLLVTTVWCSINISEMTLTPADKVQSALLVWSHPAQVVPSGSRCRPSVRWVIPKGLAFPRRNLTLIERNGNCWVWTPNFTLIYCFLVANVLRVMPRALASVLICL